MNGPADARAHYLVACDHDRAGREAEAVVHYRLALELGLSGEDRRGAQLGLGSSLRNVGEHAESVAVLSAAVAEHPHDRALRAFLALSLHDAGSPHQALAVALRIAVESVPLDGYERSLGAYCDELAARRT